jgi:hypothetical protein
MFLAACRIKGLCSDDGVAAACVTETAVWRVGCNGKHAGVFTRVSKHSRAGQQAEYILEVHGVKASYKQLQQ